MKAIGKNPFGKILEQVKKSPNYSNGVFLNIEKTEMLRKGASYLTMLQDYLRKPKDVAPAKPIPAVPFSAQAIEGDGMQVVWFGHSSYLVSCKGKRILVDPVFKNAAPVSWIGKPFPGTGIFSASDIPDIDILVITHDHYDHLEYKTLMKLKGKVKHIVCPLGVNAHLVYWGFDSSMITALDWKESATILDVSVTALSARHFSGRSIVRNKTLWNSYVLELDGRKIFIGGDSGYSTQFKETGDAYGPFDIAFIECGQYGKDWPHIHMVPEQTAQAALELKTKILLPVHWAKFTLALHPWNEPIQRLLKASEGMPYKVVSPKIGEVYAVGKEFVQEHWWEV